MKTLKLILVLIICFQCSCKAKQSFEFIVLPDTQTYVEEFPEVYMKQMEWIANQNDRFSFVLHVGDITQNNSRDEWAIAKKGFSFLDGKIPYNLALGNHDMGSEAGKFADNRDTNLANEFFPFKDYVKNARVIEVFPTNTIDNSCSEYNLLGDAWLVFSLEFGPRNRTLEWVNNLIKEHPKHKIIINTHAYLYNDNTLLDGDDWYLPQKYGVGRATGSEEVNDGGQLWEKLIKKNKNIIMVFSGHILGSGVGRLVTENDYGNAVYQMLANYQKNIVGVEKGDSGYLRIIKVDKKEKSISVKTYSPWFNQFRTEPEHQFMFKNVQL